MGVVATAWTCDLCRAVFHTTDNAEPVAHDHIRCPLCYDKPCPRPDGTYCQRCQYETKKLIAVMDKAVNGPAVGEVSNFAQVGGHKWVSAPLGLSITYQPEYQYPWQIRAWEAIKAWITRFNIG